VTELVRIAGRLKLPPDKKLRKLRLRQALQIRHPKQNKTTNRVGISTRVLKKTIIQISPEDIPPRLHGLAKWHGSC
jgi:hypothetical protein